MRARWHPISHHKRRVFPVSEVPYTVSKSRSSGIRSGDEEGLKKTLANLPRPFYVPNANEDSAGNPQGLYHSKMRSFAYYGDAPCAYPMRVFRFSGFWSYVPNP